MADPTKIVIAAEDRTGSAFASVSGGLGKIAESGGRLKEVLAGLGIAATLDGIVEKFRQTVEAADALNDMSQRVGMTVKELAGYNLAAAQSGTSLESLAKGVKSLSGYMVEHADSLKKAGISASDSSGAIKQLSDVFKNLPDGIEKTALATKLFGKAGMEMIPMLNMGSDALDKAAKKSEKYAQMMGELAPKADEFNDSLADLSAMSAGLGNSIANDLLPHMNNIVRAMIEAKKEGGLLKAVFVGLGGVAAEALAPAEETISSLTTKLEAAKKNLAARQSDSGKGFGGALNDWLNASQLKSAQEDVDRLTSSLKKLTDAREADTKAKAASSAKEKAEADAKAAAADRAAKTLLGNQQAEETAKAYETLIKSIRERIAVAEEESRAQTKLTEGEKEYAKFLAASKFAHDAKAKAMFNELVALEKSNQVRAEVKKLLEEAGKAYAEQIDQINKNTESIVDETQKIRDHSYELLNGKEAYDAMLAARQDSIIATQEEALRIAEIENATGKETEAIRKNIEALKDKKAALGEAAAAEVIKRQQEEWKRGWEETDRLAREVFTDWGMEGSNAAKKIGDTLKKALLSAIYEATLKPLAFKVFNSAASALGPTAAGAIGSVSAAMPYIAAAYVISDAAGLFGKRGGPQQGQYGDISASGYKSSYTMSGGDSLGNQTLAQSAYNQVASLYTMAGKQVSDLVIGQGYKLDPQGSASGVAYRNISIGGQTISGGTFDGNNGGQWYGAKDDAAGAAGYLGKLQGSEILAVVEAIGDAEFSATVAKLAANFEDLTVGLTQYTAAQATQKQLLAAMATDDERQALMLAEAHKALDSTFAALGQTVPASAAGFRDLVSGLDLTTQAGQDTLAKLTGVSDAFLLVANAAKEAEQEQNNWRLKLDIIQGKYTEQQAERFFALNGAADDATRAIMRQVWALEDQQVAAAAAADAAKIAADALAELSARAASVKSAAYGAYSGLLSATGNEKGALEFNVSAAQEAYQQALAAVAGNAGISSAAAQGYIDANGGIASAAAKYWGELGSGMDEATIRSKELLTDLVSAASGVAQAQSALKGFNDQAAISVDTVSQVADDQARAQQQIRDEWQRTADSIYETIRKLRGEMLGDNLGYAKAQTDYTIALAQARAGSQDAANRLPELATALVDLGKLNTATATEQALLTARTLAGLQDVVKNIGSTFGVAIPAFAVGTNRVPQDMLAMVHKDEAIIPAAFNPWARGANGSNDDLIAEVRALRAEVAELRAANSAENRAIASATTKTAKTLERFDGADALTVRVTA